MTDPYDYSTRAGVRPISWDDFHGLVKALAVAVAPWRPEVVLPVLRGGAYPGALLAHILQVEVYPVRLTRRQDDVVVRDTPLLVHLLFGYFVIFAPLVSRPLSDAGMNDKLVIGILLLSFGS